MAETVEFDNLFNESYPKAKRYGTLKSGETLARGEVVGKQTSDDKLVAYTDAGKSAAPFFGISPADYDATDAAIDGVEIVTGCEVNENALLFKASADSATEAFNDAARLKGVHVVPFISGAVATSA